MQRNKIHVNRLQLTLHLIFWLLLFLLPYLLQPSFRHNPHHDQGPLQGPDLLYFNIIKCIGWMVLFYLNAYMFVPRFLNRTKYLMYGLLLVAALVVLSLIEVLYFFSIGNIARFDIHGFLVFNILPFLFIIACSTAYKMFGDRASLEQQASEKEKEQLKSELAFLRSQISPHFMFNVLNNMVALARKKSDLLEPSLIKLSSLMRYFLYENNEEKVPLEKEIEYLKSYIDLQHQRFGSNLELNMTVEEIDHAYEIEPMLLIPFVENAFKHGIMYKGFINIQLSVRKGVLHFCVENPYVADLPVQKDSTSGIGLSNVKRRLRLLYEHNHELLISSRDGIFKVSLELKLQ